MSSSTAFTGLEFRAFVLASFNSKATSGLKLCLVSSVIYGILATICFVVGIVAIVNNTFLPHAMYFITATGILSLMGTALSVVVFKVRKLNLLREAILGILACVDLTQPSWRVDLVVATANRDSEFMLKGNLSALLNETLHVFDVVNDINSL